MEKTKNNVLKVILLSFLAFVVCLTSFIFLGKGNQKTVFADTTTTNFYGSSFYVPVQIRYYDNMDYTWSTMIWTGLSNFDGQNVWNIVNTYYYSSGSNQYVLNTSTNTWSTYTWTGLNSFYGRSIWNIGNTYYYSSGSTQYVLNTSTNTWSTYTWTGLNSFYGYNIWSIGDTYYYSSGSNQYVLNTSTNTWSTITWNGLNSFTGQYVWNIGDLYYYSSGSTQYFLDTSTNTWLTMTWNGLSNFDGRYVWNTGDTYYYSNGPVSGSNQYVLDTSTNTWLTMTWIGLSLAPNLLGFNVWNIGDLYYYSSGSNQYVLDTTKIFFENSEEILFTSNVFNFVQLSNGNFEFSLNSVIYSFFLGSVTYSISDKFVLYDTSLDMQSNVLRVYDNSNYLDSYTILPSSMNFAIMVPFKFFNSFNVLITGCFRVSVYTSGLTSVNFSKVSFTSDASQNQVSDYSGITNIVSYYNSLDEYIKFSFSYSSLKTTPVYYYADNSSVFSDYVLFTASGRESHDYYFRFNSRTYYLSADSVGSEEYLKAYNDGYYRGHLEGYSEGYRNASSAVSDAQYNAGYSAGYAAGADAGANYSFFGLISAVVDAPISYFISLFDFEILGTNISNFILALFTLSIVIFILKKVI